MHLPLGFSAEPGKITLPPVRWCRKPGMIVSDDGTEFTSKTGGDLKELLSFLGRYHVGARFFLSGMRRDGKSLVSSN